ncbi:hypothetical protein DFS33DRAFT_1457141 [Desarmillaria ectypa]|nr:hypothetical protein DFS33DRAFT_1457141 [Desarmillaria ectypa]
MKPSKCSRIYEAGHDNAFMQVFLQYYETRKLQQYSLITRNLQTSTSSVRQTVSFTLSPFHKAQHIFHSIQRGLNSDPGVFEISEHRVDVPESTQYRQEPSWILDCVLFASVQNDYNVLNREDENSVFHTKFITCSVLGLLLYMLDDHACYVSFINANRMIGAWYLNLIIARRQFNLSFGHYSSLTDSIVIDRTKGIRERAQWMPALGALNVILLAEIRALGERYVHVLAYRTTDWLLQ